MHMIAWILLVVGGLNWLLIGVGEIAGGDWNVIRIVLGSWPMIEAIVYILVGLAAIYQITTHRAHCRTCASNTSVASNVPAPAAM